MMQSDKLAALAIKEALNLPNLTKEGKQILNLVQELMPIYSFEKFQTYPRPSHPDPEKRTSVYFTMIAILLSLRTTLENEQRATTNFRNRFKSPEQVLQSSPEEIGELIKMAGMPNQKAQTILNFTRYFIQELGEDFEQFRSMPIDEARTEIMKIPGVGQKSADCLLELGLDRSTMVIDVNMLRVLSRIFNFPWAKNPDLSQKSQILAVKELVEKHLPAQGFLFQIIHTLLLVHGKMTCKSIPQCEKCKMQKYCQYFK
ncbi:MAG TPA: hypothetical protein PLQ36_00690 [Candidatus Gracilibacteria bacterium]|nr:hypothetical protein [Candidatus Gracilibacteria bacterium]